MISAFSWNRGSTLSADDEDPQDATRRGIRTRIWENKQKCDRTCAKGRFPSPQPPTQSEEDLVLFLANPKCWTTSKEFSGRFVDRGCAGAVFDRYWTPTGDNRMFRKLPAKLRFLTISLKHIFIGLLSFLSRKITNKDTREVLCPLHLLWGYSWCTLLPFNLITVFPECKFNSIDGRRRASRRDSTKSTNLNPRLLPLGRFDHRIQVSRFGIWRICCSYPTPRLGGIQGNNWNNYLNLEIWLFKNCLNPRNVLGWTFYGIATQFVPLLLCSNSTGVWDTSSLASFE